MGGAVPFDGDALLYRVHKVDAARAIVHCLENGLAGIYNVVHNDIVPPSNRAVFDDLADRAGLERLAFSGIIRLPTREISAQKIMDSGYTFEKTDYVFV
jgi:nucleoside-diphosphate-sugar epimerase